MTTDERSSPCAGCDPGNPGAHLPPPACLDLGNGEAIMWGTADDMRAADAYLRQHYPDGVTGPRYGPVFGPVLDMTWTKLGDEFGDEARDLTDAELRTHIEALGWSNRRGLDLHIPKRDLNRFAESEQAGEAVTGLLVKGWWEERGDDWYVGVKFPEWQLERAVVEQRREASALRMRRSRMHKAGDHSICLPEHCAYVTRNETRDVTRNETRNPVRVGTGPMDPPDPPEDQDQNHSVANSQKPRVHDGPDGHFSPTPADETTTVGESPQTVTRANDTVP